jgi:hypothetical protein
MQAYLDGIYTAALAPAGDNRPAHILAATLEPCDDGDTNNTNACSNACTVPTCGDGIVQPNGANGAVGGGDDEETADPEERRNAVGDAPDTLGRLQSILVETRDAKRRLPVHRNPIG